MSVQLGDVERSLSKKTSNDIPVTLIVEPPANMALENMSAEDSASNEPSASSTNNDNEIPNPWHLAHQDHQREQP